MWSGCEQLEAGWLTNPSRSTVECSTVSPSGLILKPRMLPCDNSMLTNDWTECSRPLTTDSEHVLGSLVDLDEDSIVNLPQSEQLENLLDLGRHLVDTTDSHDKDELGLSGDIEVSLLLGITLKPK